MNYVENIAAVFLTRFPSVAVLDPADCTLIAEWEKQQIPGGLVVNAIDEFRSEQQGSGMQVTSITVCQENVKKKFQEWLRTAPGRQDH